MINRLLAFNRCRVCSGESAVQRDGDADERVNTRFPPLLNLRP